MIKIVTMLGILLTISLLSGCATLAPSDPRMIAWHECRSGGRASMALIPDAGITYRRVMFKCMDAAGWVQVPSEMNALEYPDPNAVHQYKPKP